MATSGGADRSDAARVRPPSPELARETAVRAWCLYDWANSGFATSVVAAILPVWFATVASRTMEPHEATARWGFASAAAMLASGMLGPVVGAWADRSGRRKPLLLGLVLMGCSATATLALVPSAGWLLLLVGFGLGFLAFAVGNAIYDSLLPAVATPAEMHAVSARGFAWGYIGGGVLLAINLLWILMPHRFGLPDADAATRLSLASVAIWWLGFSIPLFRHVPEPPGTGEGPNPVVQTWRTLLSLRRRPELLTFLIAFWIYSDGIGTIIKMATVYGSEIGIGRNHLIGALLMVQILAAPATLLFGRLARRTGPQRAVAIGLMGYVGVTALGYLMSRPIHFWLIAILVAMFQGGTQALSRSMFVSMVPPRQTAEMFGFYSISEKFAGVVGPLLFGLVAQWTGAGRFAVLTLVPFFAVGALLLMKVDLAAGARRAREG
jgi:UMF1 family MFS transporter